jgi:phage shock protein A
MTESDQPIEAEIVDDPAPAPAPAPPAFDYDEHGVPSFDYVRNKIEDRYATSVGATELAEDTTEARTLEQQAAAREKAAKAKLDEIRKSLGAERGAAH